ncbi:MAG: FGGY-family carbohydrate kinase [Coleofasciculaceae cyanobacterium SM2_1_6]|nr:FGGY-family carbohydrate kinase [Coleofasciculaceae cyanobacterium SM2_1_6]
MTLALGIDFGTSGVRAVVINSQLEIVAEADLSFPANINSTDLSRLPLVWQQSLFAVLEKISKLIRQQVTRIAIDGTSSTVMLCDRQGSILGIPLLYNDDRAQELVKQISLKAPANHLVISATSSLSKLLWLHANYGNSPDYYLLHQADWLGFLLHQQLGLSDYHNALKLGYDVVNLRYPQWLLDYLAELKFTGHLPQVLAPGQVVGNICQEVLDRFHLPPECQVCAGTTDSIAAFLASGAKTPGEAVTSLGSTLVIKLLSTNFVEDVGYGIYSHRLGDLWLVGGASNTGGAVLRHYFSDRELTLLSQEINPGIPSQLDYYPLLKPGDRFPTNDPQLLPRISPIPAQQAEFLHGLLESMACIEAQGYQLLRELGATPVHQIYTAGGGAHNPTWTAIRHRRLQVPVTKSRHTAAAYGTAKLALESFSTKP